MVVLQENPLDLLVQAKSAWDQFRGKEVPLPKDLVRANAQEIKSNPDLDQINKEFTKTNNKDYSVKVSRSSGVAVVTFDAGEVPVSLSDDFKDNGKYDKYVLKYDPESQEVTLVFPLNSSTEESLKESSDSFDYDDDFEIDEDGLLLKYHGNKANVVIPDSVTEIASGAFRGCTSLTTVTIPNSVTEIGKEAFRNCTSLTNIKIPDSVTKIYWDAFHGCDSLKSVTIPDSVKKIYSGAFQGCDSLKSVTILGSATEVDDLAFSWCASLVDVSIPDSVEINSSVFRSTPLESEFEERSATKGESYVKEESRILELKETKKLSLQKLKSQLTDALSEVMTSPDFGFEEDEVNEYSGVGIHEDQGDIVVDVWAEVGFEGLWDIKDSLDPIVAYYDKDAYFDMETSGRLSAILQGFSLKESGNPFKSHFICSGCGKTLDQCTCEVESEGKIDESLRESSDSFDYDEDSEADQALYDAISTFLADRFCPAFNIDVNIVSQFSRFEDIMESLVRMVKQGRDATKGESLKENIVFSAEAPQGKVEVSRHKDGTYRVLVNGEEHAWYDQDDLTSLKYYLKYKKDIPDEDLDKATLFKEATQTSSIGQHKVDLIDLSEDESQTYSIVRTGGSVGEKSPVIIDSGLSKEEATEQAKVLRKNLSPGDKKYYGIKYRVVPDKKASSVRR